MVRRHKVSTDVGIDLVGLWETGGQGNSFRV